MAIALSLSLAPSSTSDESKAILKAERKIDDCSSSENMIEGCQVQSQFYRVVCVVWWQLDDGCMMVVYLFLVRDWIEMSRPGTSVVPHSIFD